MDYHTTTLAAHQRQVDEQAARDAALEALTTEAADVIERAMTDLQAVPQVFDGKTLGTVLPSVLAVEVMSDALADDDSDITQWLKKHIESHAGKELRQLIGQAHAERTAAAVAKLWAKGAH